MIRFFFVAFFAVLAATAGAQSQQWPINGKIRYEVFRGQDGMQLGVADHTWSHDGKQYEMSLDVRTTGVVAVLYRLQYTQHSRGAMDSNGLVPQRFNIEQKGRKPEEAVFDWKTHTVSIRRGGTERKNKQIAPGDQDVLSTWHQIALIDPTTFPYSLSVATAKNVKEVDVVALGTERIRLSIGEMDTQRIRVRSEDGSMEIDMWLARDEMLLPVRVMITTDKDEKLDLRATLLNFTDAKGKTRSLSSKS